MDERLEILNESIRLTSQVRGEVYGSFVDNMDLLGQFIRLYQQHAGIRYSAAHDAAIINLLGKIARVAVGNLHRDNYVDGPNYFAAAYEAELKYGTKPGLSMEDIEYELTKGIVNV